MAGTGDSLIPGRALINDRSMVLRSAAKDLDTVSYVMSGKDGEAHRLKAPYK
ncbi:MAG: hypothetical protein KBH07_03210 [Flavobacteriales bacterium]|nr:hypothetical protein [Flavobacteriales bacterium]MBP9080873.1 hypothetical protein [Flavobacteriales bacterium]